jgi:hypothetical protein
MIHSQDQKWVSLITPQSVATNATASATVNCAGFRHATVVLHLATQTAANTDTAITLSEGDGTSFATSADFAMTTAAPDTSNAQVYVWLVNLKGGRKKNLKIQYTPGGTARVASCHAVLSRSETAPDSLTERGLTGQVVI